MNTLRFGALPMSVPLVLILLPLAYVAHFRSNIIIALVLWTNQLSNWNGNNQDEYMYGRWCYWVYTKACSRGRIELETTGFSCDSSSLHSDICVFMDLVTIDMQSTTVYIPKKQSLPPTNWTVQPYARKGDKAALKNVAKVETIRGIKNKPPPPCDVFHNVSAVVFSAGGFRGNFFHEFNDVIVPLFLTTRHFQAKVQLVVTDYKEQWNSKYRQILTSLSNYRVINPAEDKKVYCFPGGVVAFLFLRDSFSLKIENVKEIEKPVLLLVSRQRTRAFLNENDILGLATELGFNAITTTPGQMSNLSRFSSKINSCTVLLGVHGAGLTNALFLPDGAVLLQVVALGTDWASATYFGNKVGKMNIHYLEYKISSEESWLLNKYGRDSPVINDPASIGKQGFAASSKIYLHGQNVTLDILRFRKTLLQALELLRR
ncbi:hypothetical protein MKW94_028438 [Papaver nudicaule]|uniref:Glycosyltransferase 61 catalytic domain-containing protein n=1 Tax=Papaver nudicaule TaxID=74823 RepID=A0AA41V329_PAPNU|nr:hypothetical protein [Papaver nudicaule]